MGFHYRKSISLGGGFRVNISSSGIGYSWGVLGYRISRSASGKIRETYSIPKAGIRYTKDHTQNGNPQPASSNQPNQDDINYTDVHNIESASIADFQANEYENFINSIDTIIKLNKLSTLLSICIVLAFYPIFLILGIIGIILKLFLHFKCPIKAEYSFEDEKENEYKKRIEAWKSLNNCNKLWQINQTANIRNSKISGGATSAITRLPLSITTELPWYLKSNVDAIVLKFKTETMIILPDRLLLIQKKGIGAIKYESIKYDLSITNFRETEKPPSDAEFIKNTWKYVNKNGQPDKRFKDNCQIPIYKYIRINLSSEEGLNACLMCSNESIARNFENTIL